MSVINDMLRDLEQRNAPEREALAGSSRSLVASSESSAWQRNKLALTLAGLVLLLLLLVAWLLVRPAIDPESAAQSNTAPEAVVRGDVKSDVQADAKVDIESPVKVAIEQAITPAFDAATEPKQATKRSVEAALMPAQAQGAPSSPKSQNKPAQAQGQNQAKTELKTLPVVDEEIFVKTPQPLVDSKVMPSQQADGKLKQLASVTVATPTEPRLSTQTLAPNVEQEQGAVLVDGTLSAGEPAQTSVINTVRNEVRLTPAARDHAEAQRIAELYKVGDLQSAEQAAYAFIEKHEQHQYTKLVLVNELLSSNQLGRLAALLADVDSQSLAALRMAKARWYAQGDQLNLGASLLAVNLPSVAQHSDYHALLASYYQQLGRYDQAVARYSSLLEFNPEQASWWVGMAIGLDRLARYKDAITAYRQALALPNIAPSLAQFSNQRLTQLRASGTP